MSPTAKTRCPSSRRACRSASRDGSRNDGPSGMFNLQLRLFTEEGFSSCYRCLNHYMFFPLKEGGKSRFSDLSTYREPNHSVSAASSFDFSSSSVEVFAAPMVPIATIAIPPTQNSRVT